MYKSVASFAFINSKLIWLVFFFFCFFFSFTFSFRVKSIEYPLRRHFTREALPRLDNYRDILSVQAVYRPTLDDLHNATMPNKVSTPTNTITHYSKWFILNLMWITFVYWPTFLNTNRRHVTKLFLLCLFLFHSLTYTHLFFLSAVIWYSNAPIYLFSSIYNQMFTCKPLNLQHFDVECEFFFPHKFHPNSLRNGSFDKNSIIATHIWMAGGNEIPWQSISTGLLNKITFFWHAPSKTQTDMYIDILSILYLLLLRGRFIWLDEKMIFWRETIQFFFH